MRCDCRNFTVVGAALAAAVAICLASLSLPFGAVAAVGVVVALAPLLLLALLLRWRCRCCWRCCCVGTVVALALLLRLRCCCVGAAIGFAVVAAALFTTARKNLLFDFAVALAAPLLDCSSLSNVARLFRPPFVPPRLLTLSPVLSCRRVLLAISSCAIQALSRCGGGRSRRRVGDLRICASSTLVALLSAAAVLPAAARLVRFLLAPFSATALLVMVARFALRLPVSPLSCCRPPLCQPRR